ncbi:MAG: DNA repair protein RecO [Clostridia bacterium]|nr:DNA repair protein RecO [Clostridia bacterium]
MKLIKVKGIVIRESTYKDNDKIITILTDSIGKVSVIAKGAKKTNSPYLASSQYLVYSEFVLYQNTGYFYLNSASVINTFYNLRIDLDKLQIVFELTKLINSVTDENQDCEKILKLFLNTIYALDKLDKDKKLIVNAFKIKLFTLLGFAPRQDKCANCSKLLLDAEEEFVYYNYVDNVFLCENCKGIGDSRSVIRLTKATFNAIFYVIRSDLKKMFSFELKSYTDFELFGQVFTDTIFSGI